MWAYDITGQEKMMFEGDESPTILSLTGRGISSSPGISVRIHPILRILRQCDDSEKTRKVSVEKQHVDGNPLIKFLLTDHI